MGKGCLAETGTVTDKYNEYAIEMYNDEDPTQLKVQGKETFFKAIDISAKMQLYWTAQ